MGFFDKTKSNRERRTKMKHDVKTIFNTTKRKVLKRSPEILTGLGVAGMITTVVLSVKATPKAMKLIEEEKINRQAERETVDDQDSIELTKLEVVKVAWKPYIPAAVTGVISVGCLIGATSVSTRRTAAIATAYKLSETALSEYREKVVETIGEKKEKTVRDNIAKDKVEKNPVANSEVILTGIGETLCYEPISGRYFKSDINKIRSAVNDINEQMFSENYASLNDLNGKLDLPYTNIGYDLGWDVYNGLLQVEFSSQITDDGTPCIVIDYITPPRYNFDKFA